VDTGKQRIEIMDLREKLKKIAETGVKAVKDFSRLKEHCYEYRKM
jgi:hypothetical protein